MTVIVSSHILEELEKVADAFGIIHDGKLIDEFSAEELESRCSKYILLKTGDLEKTKQVLADNGLEKYEVLNNGNIRIIGEVEDTSKLIASLVGAGVAVYELASVQGTLEQYYLNRTGGEA